MRSEGPAYMLPRIDFFEFMAVHRKMPESMAYRPGPYGWNPGDDDNDCSLGGDRTGEHAVLFRGSINVSDGAVSAQPENNFSS